MPVILDGMFHGNGNLSARQPLLHEPQKPSVVPQRGPPPRDFVLQRPLPAPRNIPTPRLVTSPYESRVQNGYKVGYVQDEAAPDLSSLFFRFETNESPEYLTSQHRDASVRYAKPAVPANGFPDRLPERDGPFVFGVHTPCHFPIQRHDDEDYDYSEVTEENNQTVIRDDVPNGLNYCDRVNEWTANEKKSRWTLSCMPQLKSRRKNVSRKKKIKCVLVGDGAVGKSSLIAAYAQDTFREEYQPTAYDTFNVAVDVDDRPVCVEICDTAGQDSMSELRELCYPGTDVLMLCFSIVRPETFRSVAERWTRSVAGVNAPLLLIGTQSDLAEDPRVLHSLRIRREHPVTEAEGKALAAKINAVVYIETSSKTRKQLKDAFDAAIAAGLPVLQRKRPFWKKLLCLK